MKTTSPTSLSPLQAAFPVYDEEHLYFATGEQHAGLIAAAALRAAADQLFPYEKSAPKADFDCEPTPRYNFKTGKCDGPLGYDHGAYLRRSWAQDDLNKEWKTRQESRAQLLALAAELDPITTTEPTDD